MSLAGKIAVITGASRGLGLATGLALQAQGVTVFGTSRTPGHYASPFPLLPLDITDPSSLDAFVGTLATELYGRPIDILINNAGRYVVGTPVPVAPGLNSYFEDQARLGLETLYVGHVRVTNSLLPLMRPQGYARLRYTVSIASSVVGGTDEEEQFGVSFSHVYNAGKRALLAYANNLRGFLRTTGSNIKVSTVNPMFMNTTLVDGLHPIHQLHSREFRIPGFAGSVPPGMRLAPQSCLPAMNCAGTSMVLPENVSCSAMFAANAVRRCL